LTFFATLAPPFAAALAGFGAGFAVGSTKGMPNRAARFRRFSSSSSSAAVVVVVVAVVAIGSALSIGFAAAGGLTAAGFCLK